MSDAIIAFIILAILYVITTAIENKGKQFSRDGNYVPKMVTSSNTGPAESVVPMGTIYFTEDGGGRTYNMVLDHSMDNFEAGTTFAFRLKNAKDLNTDLGK